MRFRWHIARFSRVALSSRKEPGHIYFRILGQSSHKEYDLADHSWHTCEAITLKPEEKLKGDHYSIQLKPQKFGLYCKFVYICNVEGEDCAASSIRKKWLNN